MSIPIIGASAAASPKLPRVEVDIPPPSSAPELAPVRDRAAWASLAEHPAPMARGVLLEHIARSAEPLAWADVLTKLASEGTGAIAERALQILGDLGHAPAAEIAAKRFADADGELAAASAIVLGRLDPARLLAATKARARLDDMAYVQTMSALARAAEPDAIAYLDKSLNRAGAQTPQRRAALYSAALLSGSPGLCARVVGIAISESRAEPAEGEPPSAARIAIASIAGLPPAMAGLDAGADVLEGLEQAKTEAKGPELEGLMTALGHKDVLAALDAVAPLVARTIPSDASADQRSVLTRKQGLLKAIVDQRAQIARLEQEAAALYVAAAFAAAELVALASAEASASPALATIGKLMSADPAELLALDDAALAARLGADGERRLRQLVGALSGESSATPKVLDRLIHAIVRAGGAAVVFDAAAATKLEGFAGIAIKALLASPAAAEAAALEALERRPLDERATRLALALAGRLGTERLARVMGRRYYELRDAARNALADACIHVGDVRLTPLVESRAYKDEPEELAYVMLRIMAGAELTEPKVASLLERVATSGNPTVLGEVEAGIRLPLQCGACKETFSYTMVRVYLDPKSKAKDGDPAFAGDVRCKACGAEDMLQATPVASNLMMESMMRLLEEQQAGHGQTEPPRVIPRTTRYMGRELGLAEALRKANADVEGSPSSIRGRLRRGQLRLALWRGGAREDAEAALAIDPRSPEALLLLGGSYGQVGDFAGALERFAAALEIVRAADEPRLYEAEEDALREEIEDAILELEDMDVELPAALDLTAARERRDAVIDKLLERRAAQER